MAPVAILGLLVAPLAALAATSTAAGAGTTCGSDTGSFTAVTSNADTGTGTLRTALTTANTNTGAQTICIDTTLVTTPIVLSSNLTVYNHASDPLTIQGNGATINGNGNSAIGSNSTGLLTIDSLTIVGANNAGSGGGVFANTGSVTLTSSTISGNTSGGDGGGVVALGAVTITNSTISGNTTAGLGGGIGTSGLTTITDSTVSNNSGTGATSEGGGVAATTGVVVSGSTISGNTLTDSGGGGGGGISANTATVTNSTISGNSAGSDGDGGGIESGAIQLVYVTLVQNSSVHAGANLDGSSLASFGSVVAQAVGGGSNCNVTGTTTSHGFNFTDDPNATTSCKFNGTGDSVGVSNNPLLGPLANNGGPTETMLPQDGPSPLIDAIPAADCGAMVGIGTDQRGFPRPDSASPNCDIGAVEVQVTVVTPTLTAAFTG